MATVLVADPGTRDRDFISRALERAGCGVLQASSLAEALGVLEAAVPDAVVTDTGGAELDGFDLLRRIRRRDRGLPVVLATSRESEECAARAIREGASGLLVKPVDEETLRRTVQAALAGPIPVASPLASRRAIFEKDRTALAGKLAFGLAHELRPPLSAALLHLALLRGKIGEGAAEDLDAALGALSSCCDLTDSLLGLSRPGDADHERFDLGRIAAASLRLVEHRFRERRLRLRSRLRPGGFVRGRAREAQQIVLNLLVNAVEAAEPGGSVHVAAARRGPEACVTVADDGPGLTPESEGRVFEPFFTTKPDGMGLGLAISQELAQRRSGAIDIARRAGRTRFRLRLPIERGAG